MDNTPHAEGGLLSTLTRMFKTLWDAAESRVELFVAEWREERLRLLDIVVLLVIGALCGFMALLLVTFAVIVIFWSTHPILVVGLLILFYAVMAGLAFAMLHLQIRRLGMFTATLEQIRKDLACFKEKS